MSGLTKIEWADAVWNPINGCTKVSEGCRNCYAERMATRLAGRAGYPAEHPFAVTLHPEHLEEPLHWRKGRRIFVCSMSDLFHPGVPDGFIIDVWSVMDSCPQHTFQILTKRPDRMANLTGPGEVPRPWELPNVWLGTSVEDQATADERIPHLLRCPAAVRFVSYEPALGPIDLHLEEIAIAFEPGSYGPNEEILGPLHWAIAGGESGPKARPAHPVWFRSVRDQCQAAGVPFFFTQWGEWVPRPTPARREDANWPPVLYRPGCRDPLRWVWVDRVGKKAAGRLLDGVEHNAYPGDGRS